ncbi:transcriptional regulator GcvA [Pendulispora rubella]|uniref:Transcriptional regulator GcvA n=1 Tax=Pendulispora rubella TaxID=2741070 RepID=A0ABZ2KVA2_9BACT
MALTNRETRAKASEKVSLASSRRLPPLNAVRAFEAAARQGGFQAAGAELHVSANAVGRLVKILEDWLGVPLFRRLARGVALTDAGRDYLDRVTPLLDQLAEATADLQRAESSKVLTVSAVPSFAARWLMPRFGRFTARYPELDVRVLASVPPTDFAREGVDVAIRLGPGTYEGLRSDLLLHEDFFPVCSPRLAAGKPRLRKPKDLAKHVLLHEEWEWRIPLQIDWPRWLGAMGISGVDARRGPRFSYSHMTLQAAEEGQGVALASSALVGDALASRRLVRPFGDRFVRGPYGFFIVSPLGSAARDKVVAFRDWALEEATSTFVGRKLAPT